MTPIQQQDYIQKVTEFINSDNPYEQERNTLLQELSRLTLDIQQTTDPTELNILQSQSDNILAQLEGLGVVSQDVLEGNEQYYVDKYEQAKDRLNQTDDDVLFTVDVDMTITQMMLV